MQSEIPRNVDPSSLVYISLEREKQPTLKEASLNIRVAVKRISIIIDLANKATIRHHPCCWYNESRAPGLD